MTTNSSNGERRSVIAAIAIASIVMAVAVAERFRGPDSEEPKPKASNPIVYVNEANLREAAEDYKAETAILEKKVAGICVEDIMKDMPPCSVDSQADVKSVEKCAKEPDVLKRLECEQGRYKTAKFKLFQAVGAEKWRSELMDARATQRKQKQAADEGKRRTEQRPMKIPAGH